MPTNRIFGTLILCLLFFQFSCQKVKVNELIPDSCQVLVRINFPELISAKGQQEFISNTIFKKWNLKIEDSGLDFFQPAYFFQTSLEDQSGFFLLVGIASETSFLKTLQQIHPNGMVSEMADFQTYDLKNAKVVWQKNLCVFYFFNPITGPVFQSEEISQILVKEKLKRGNDPFIANEMISFRAKVEEENTLPLLPPLEASISGNMQLNAEKWEMDAVLKEGQFSTFLLPFEEPNFEEKENCQIKLALKPDWKKLGEMLSNYFDIPFVDELIEKLSAIDGPVYASILGCSQEEIQQNVELMAIYKNLNEAQETVDLYKKLGSIIRLPEAFKIENSGNQVHFSGTERKGPFMPLPEKLNNNALAKLLIKQKETYFSLVLQPGNDLNETRIKVNVTNPEKFDFSKPEDFLDKLPL